MSIESDVPFHSIKLRQQKKNNRKVKENSDRTGGAGGGAKHSGWQQVAVQQVDPPVRFTCDILLARSIES